MRLTWDPDSGLPAGGPGWPVTEISMVYMGGLALLLLSTLAMHYRRAGRASVALWRLCGSLICHGRVSRHPVCVVIKDKPRRAQANDHVSVNISQLQQQQQQKHPQIAVPHDDDSWTIKSASSPLPHSAAAACADHIHSDDLLLHGAIPSGTPLHTGPCTPPRQLELPPSPGGLLQSWSQWQPSWPATPCLSLPSASPHPDATPCSAAATSPQPAPRKGQDMIFSQLLDNLVVNFLDREPSECSDLDSNIPTPQSHHTFFPSRAPPMFAAGACAAPSPGRQGGHADELSCAVSSTPPPLSLMWKPMPELHAFQSASITVSPPAVHDSVPELPVSTSAAAAPTQVAVPAVTNLFEEPEAPVTPRTPEAACKALAPVSCFLQQHQQAFAETKSPAKKAVALRSGLPPIRVDQPLMVSRWEWMHVQQQRKQHV